MATGSVDFGDYDLGALPAGWEESITSGTGSISVVELANSVSGKALRIQRASSNFKATAALVDTAFRDGEVLALLRIDQDLAMGAVIGRATAASVAAGNDNGARLQSLDGGFSLDVLDQAAASGTTWVTPNYLGERLWVRYNLRDNGVDPTRLDFRCKTWLYGNEEPEAWSETALSIGGAADRSGYPGVAANLQGGSFGSNFYCEYLSWSNDLATDAPMPGGGDEEPRGRGRGRGGSGSPGGPAKKKGKSGAQPISFDSGFPED